LGEDDEEKTTRMTRWRAAIDEQVAAAGGA